TLRFDRERMRPACPWTSPGASGKARIGTRPTTHRPAYAPAMSATPSAQYSLTIRVEIAHRPGMLGQVATAIGRAGGVIGAVDLVEVAGDRLLRDITVDAADPDQWHAITD